MPHLFMSQETNGVATRLLALSHLPKDPHAQRTASDTAPLGPTVGARAPRDASPPAIASTFLTGIGRLHLGDNCPSLVPFVRQAHRCAPKVIIMCFTPSARSFVAARLTP